MPLEHQRSYFLYKPKLKLRARDLRKNCPPAERRLWQKLRGGQLLGYKFQRQKPVGNYIVDFYCYQLKLVIEIDGFSHDFKMDYDQKRQEFLEKLGLKVLKFSDKQVLKEVDGVIQIIVDFIIGCAEVSHPPLRPPARGDNYDQVSYHKKVSPAFQPGVFFV